MYSFWLMITLKFIKAVFPVCDVKNLKQSFSSVSGKLTTLGLFLLKIKIKEKRKLDSLFFSGENNSEAIKNCQFIQPAPLIKVSQKRGKIIYLYKSVNIFH